MKFDLSIVAAVRNDDYGGDFFFRLNNFINWNLSLLSRVDIKTELVLVNWNFIANENDLKSKINLKVKVPNSVIKIVNVPNDIHRQVISRFKCKDVPVLEYHAKNTGIQRATGNWILCCNPDILFDPSLVLEIKKGIIGRDVFYRVNRVDFNLKIRNGLLSYDNLNLIKLNSFQINFKGFTQKIKSYSFFNVFRAYIQNEFSCIWRLNTYRFKRIFEALRLKVYYYNVDYMFHTNASGDFLLMEKKWFNYLKGYPETNFISLHTDSEFVIMCGFTIREVTFKNPIFHLDHERRFNSYDIHNVENRDAYKRLQKMALKMKSIQKPICNIHDDWGLKSVSLNVDSFCEA